MGVCAWRVCACEGCAREGVCMRMSMCVWMIQPLLLGCLMLARLRLKRMFCNIKYANKQTTQL